MTSEFFKKSSLGDDMQRSSSVDIHFVLLLFQ